MDLLSGYSDSYNPYPGGYSPQQSAAFNASMAQSMQNTRDVMAYAQQQTDQHNYDVQTHGPSSGYGMVGGYPSFGDPAAPGTYSPGNVDNRSSFSGQPMGGGQTFYQPTDLGPNYGYTPPQPSPSYDGGWAAGDYWGPGGVNITPGYNPATQHVDGGAAGTGGYPGSNQPYQPPPQYQPQYQPQADGGPAGTVGYPGSNQPYQPPSQPQYQPVQFPPMQNNDPYSVLRGGSNGENYDGLIYEYDVAGNWLGAGNRNPYATVGGGGYQPSFNNPAGDFSPGDPGSYGGGYTPFAPSSPGDRYPLYGQPGGAQPQGGGGGGGYNPFDYSRVGEAAGYPSNMPSANMPDWARYWSPMDGSNPWFGPGGGGGDAGASGGFTSAGDFGGGIDWSRPQGQPAAPPFNAMNNYNPGMWGDTQNLGRGVGRDDIAYEIMRQQMPGLQTPGNLEEMRRQGEEEMRRANPPGPQSYYDGGWGGSTMSG